MNISIKKLQQLCKLIRGKDQCFWNQLQNHLFQKLETSEYRRIYVYARVYLSLYYAHVCVFIVYLQSMHVHLHTRRLYPLCDISKRTLSQGKKILAGTKCHTFLSIHLHKNISLTRSSVTQREKRDKKKQSNELVLSNRSSPIYPDKARASYLYIILHKFLNSLKTSLMKRNGK